MIEACVKSRNGLEFRCGQNGLLYNGAWQRKMTFNDRVLGSGVWFGDNRTLYFTLQTPSRQEIGIIENYLAATLSHDVRLD